MTRASGIIHRLALAVIFTASLATGLAADRKPFTTSKTLAEEAQTLVKLLDEMHYNKDAVSNQDYKQVIPDYMSDLDGQRLFFLESDRAKFVNEEGGRVYYNTAFLGNINVAYEIFYV